MTEELQNFDPTPEVTALSKEPALEKVIAGLSNNLQTKLQAYQLFLGTDKTPDEIGLTLALPVFLVKHWISTEEWGKKKANWLAQEFKRKEVELQSLRSEHAIPTARRHLETAQLMEEEIKEIIESMRSDRKNRQDDGKGIPRNYDMTINRLSQALKNVTDISSRIVGLDNNPKLSDAETAKTIIMIGGKPAQGNRFAEEKKAEVIDIKVDD